MMTNSGVEQAPLVAVDVDANLVPVPRDGVVTTQLDDDLVLMSPADDNLCVLNPSAALIWRCFDGEGTLAEIADDLAQAFAASREDMRDQVIGITRWIGEEGMLEGVVPSESETPAGQEIGTELPAFALPGADGQPIELADLRGAPALLVNWSPHCGYCERIAPELAGLQPALASRGVRLVFVTAGTPDDNRELFQAWGLEGMVMFREGGPDEFDDPFAEMGTPVAYLLDAEGRVEAPLAYGASEVPELASKAGGLLPMVGAPSEPPVQTDAAPEPSDGGGSGGHDDDEAQDEDPAGPLYIPLAAGVCKPGTGPKKKARTWAPTAAYQVGDFHVGIRADSEATGELLARAFAGLRLAAETPVPDNFSVVLRRSDGSSTRELSLLLRGDDTVLRSRSPRRVVTALASHLAGLLPPDPQLLRLNDLATLVDGEAVLLPAEAREFVQELPPRLARLGIRVSDEPVALVDTDSLELVVPKPTLPFDTTALDALPQAPVTRTELPTVEPGRYRIRWWGIDADEGQESVTRAQALSDTWGAVLERQAPMEEMVGRLADVFARVTLAPLAFTTPEHLIEAIQEHLIPAA